MGTFFDPPRIRALVAEIFERSGCPSERAETVADNLVQAEMRGVRSHGLVQVLPYSRHFREGRIRAGAEIEAVAEGPAMLAFDAHFAPGSVAGKLAMKRTIEKAWESGVAVSTVKNGTHFGMAAYYAMDALSENMIGLAFTSSGLLVAPFGGKTRQLGTNPICVAVPALRHRPIVFDAATSVAAYNKAFFAHTEGRPIPEGWAVSRDGAPTTDPADLVLNGGSLLPFGGYKGYGLSLVVYLITAVLSGMQDAGAIGFNFAAIDINRFSDAERFKQTVDETIDRLKSSPKADGAGQILVPGEIEFDLHERAERDGIELFGGVQQEIERAISETGAERGLGWAKKD